jgi:Ran GTPase-activating protein (RanGAP) involved in mRNA processing and transport
LAVLCADNQITDSGAEAIGIMLSVNNTLTSINLKRNQIQGAGAGKIADGLFSNNSLTELDLAGQYISRPVLCVYNVCI